MKPDCRSKTIPLDLATVRETLTYIHGNLARTSGLERAAAAVKAALFEIEAAEKRPRALPGATFTGLRFIPRKH